VWYEGFPKTLIESLAVGTPVIASDLGAMREAVTDLANGRLFSPGSAAELARCARELYVNPAQRAAMRAEARRTFETRYTMDVVRYIRLTIYQEALGRGRPVFQAKSDLTEVAGA